ncbi:type VI secretion system Vgr family protein [Nannocystaceae bacterium ST9]
MDALADPRLAPAQLEFYCDEGPAMEWSVGAVHVDEAIDRPFLAIVDLVSASPETTGFLGADCELVILRAGERRRLLGLVSAVEGLGRIEHRFGIRLTIEPAFALLRLGQNSRIWQGCSVQAVIAAVLDEGLAPYSRTHDFGSVSRGTSPRENCVQFRESDFDFVSRLLQEEGISYRFVHDDAQSHEVLTFADDNNQYPEFENVDGSAELPVIATDFEHADVESIQVVAPRQRLTVTSALERDFDWIAPTDLLTSDAGEADARGRIRRIYRHGRRRFEIDDLAERARDLVEAEALGGTVLHGESNVAGLAPGMRFQLLDDDASELEGKYLVIAVTHTSNAGLRYANRFACVPIASPLRPRALTPKPRVHGPQTAIVVGDEAIHTDEHGRIQVQFHWEEQPSHASGASCWVRCAQSFAGPGWGAQFIPRVGMEVVVEFLEGNPDRPLVTGCVYDGDNPTPFPLPDDKTQSGWRTSSVPGGEGFHELRFEDAAGAEEIHLRSQRDWSIEILHDKAQTVGNDETHAIEHDHAREVGNDQTQTIGRDQTQTIGRDQNETIGRDQTLAVGADQTAGITGNQRLSVGKDQNVEIAGNATTSIAGNATLSVGKQHAVQVMGSQTVGVEKNASLEATNVSQRARKQLTFDSGASTKITVEDRFSLGVKAKIDISGQDEGLISMAKKLVIRCGKASIELDKNGDITFKAKTFTVKASGDVVIKGKKVSSN